MNFVDLGTGYQLTGFADFESAFSATDKLCGMGLKVAYLNEATHIKEAEVKAYAKSYSAADTVIYQNYHMNKGAKPVATATESIKTAVEALEEKNQGRIRYLLVVTPNKVKAPKKQVSLMQ